MHVEWRKSCTGLTALCLFLFLATLVLQLALSARRESPTFDEGDHIFSRYTSWTRADFGLNPEHPPLVKFLATLPILRLPLHVPTLEHRRFKTEANVGGGEFLYKNNADLILFRTRMAAAALTVLLAIVLFLAAREMYGVRVAFVALWLLVFDPNILAHGALVTTDVGVACFIFATVHAFYRYVKQPSLVRLGEVGVLAGLALASKHSGLLIFPILVLLMISEVIWRNQHDEAKPNQAATGPGKTTLRMLAVLGTVVLIGIVVLWSSYGFRYAARPNGLEMNPPLEVFARELQQPSGSRIITALAHSRVLPEAYLYGLLDVRYNVDRTPSYIFGKLYRHGRWYYFPAVFLIKSSLGFLLLVLLAGLAFFLTQRSSIRWREARFLVIPPSFYFLASVFSGLNRGVRHILPIYPFLMILAAAASWSLIRQSRKWSYAVAGLLLLHAASSLRAFPTYIAYSNELWGGPANTYKYLTDSNVDWGQQLKGTAEYLRKHGVKDCWFASYVGEIVDFQYYGIPCKPLPTQALFLSFVPKIDTVPARIDGTVLVNVSLISGFEFGGRELNLYDQFEKLHPTAVIEDGVFLYEGTFDVSRASALNHAIRSWQLGDEKRPVEALEEARASASLSPHKATSLAVLGDALWDLGRHDEAREAYQRALTVAQTVQPDFQNVWIPYLRGRLAER